MDFDQLREVWQKAEHAVAPDSDEGLTRKLRVVTNTQQRFRRYFRIEMILAATAIILFGAAAYFLEELNPYFYKLFGLVLLGSLPLSIRLFLSMKQLLGINYTYQLKPNLIKAKNYLRRTIRWYHMLVVGTVVSLVVMSWLDAFFLQLPLTWQVGVMAYFLLFLVACLYLVDKVYGGELQKLEALLEDR